MRLIRKRWVPGPPQRQLAFNLWQPGPWLGWLLGSDGARWLVAASVALVVGLVLHPHLALLLLPVSTSLYAVALVCIQRQKKREEMPSPPARLSLARSLLAMQQRRPSKHKQRRLPL